jgi:altronate dehydratase large subunit
VSGLSGYPRADGRWGIRNHVLVLPARFHASRAAELLADGIEGAVAVPHEWDGRADDPDRALVERMMGGFGSNPNVAVTLVVGGTPEDERIAAAIVARGGRAEFVSLAEHGGTLATAEARAPLVRELVDAAAKLRREPMDVAELMLGLECGGSDALSGITANPALGIASDMLVAEGATSVLAEVPELVGAERLLAARAITPEVGAEVIDLIESFEATVRELGIDIRGAQPTPGNIRGGLTTIEEKSLGAAKKGGAAPVSGVLGYAETPVHHGLHIMDTPGQDIEQMVGMVAGGCQLVAFTTGRGTPTGSPIAPCLKISTNTGTFVRMAGDIDLDAGTAATGEESLREVGERIHAALLATAAGEPTSAERRGNHEFAIRHVTYSAGTAA